MDEKTRHHMAVAFSLAYGQIPATPVLDALAGPSAAHRKEETHDDEGERDVASTESPAPVAAMAAGATGPTGALRGFAIGESPSHAQIVDSNATAHTVAAGGR